MSRISLSGFDKELERRIRELARKESVSLNEAALLLMRRGAGLSEYSQTKLPIADALDEFIGRWSPADERRLLQRIAPFEAVDEARWKGGFCSTPTPPLRCSLGISAELRASSSRMLARKRASLPLTQ